MEITLGAEQNIYNVLTLVLVAIFGVSSFSRICCDPVCILLLNADNSISEIFV